MMKSKRKRSWSYLLFAGLLVAGLSLSGCGSDGDDGVDGTNGIDGVDGAPGADGMDASVAVRGESCAICHDSGFALGGSGHQEEYDKYNDASAFAMTVDGVVSVDNGDGTFTSTMTVSVTKDGAAYDEDLDGLAQKRFYVASYDSATRKFNASFSYSSPTPIGGGQHTVTTATAPFAPESSNAQAYAYIADGVLETEGMTLYDDVANAGLAFGDAGTYVSAANVTACEGCHGTPYMKHGYRSAEVAGLSDFGGCKSCHVDTTNGSHPDWQVLADNPARYAELDALAKACPDSSCNSVSKNMTADEKTKYQYNRSVMNDVHMSHNMEFPYPQEMSNCATCHEGKLNTVLVDDNFTPETCESCHAVDNLLGIMHANNAIHASIVTVADLDATDCNSCHTATAPVIAGAPLLSELHNGGYNSEIYASAGVKYSDVFTVTVDAADFDADTNMLTVEFSAAESPDIAAFDAADIVPTLMVGLYGYDTKDFIVNGHRDLEYNFGQGETGLTTEDTTVVAPNWKATVDLSTWADMITDGAIKRVEIIVLPGLGVNGALDTRGGTGEYADDDLKAMNAPSRTFNLGDNDFEEFFSPIVNVDGGCNNCHDALATTFHDGKRGGNIVACRFCHNPNSGGSHLEMQSRSIDSYVHAIHSFQAFDPGDINFDDPVEALEYAHHVEHTYPNFTIKNCESCHTPGSYDVPDQSKSLPGKLSAADVSKDGSWDRAIGAVPAYVTGPATRACGACHRADMINEDDAGKLAAFNAHVAANGYLIEDGDGVLDTVIATIMGLFK